MIKKSSTDNKVKEYIEQLFSEVGPSQQLFDLKEELTTNLKEKISDLKARGLTEDQAIKEAIISMGDLGGLVDDMRKLGQDAARQSVYSSMATRISTAGIIAGVLLVLFGMFTTAMLYFMPSPEEIVTGPIIFLVAGGALITYSVLTRETGKKYAMNKIRATLYALSVGLILFGLFVAATTGFATGQIYVGIASSMVFLLAGIGLLLGLILTGADRSKGGNK